MHYTLRVPQWALWPATHVILRLIRHANRDRYGLCVAEGARGEMLFNHVPLIEPPTPALKCMHSYGHMPRTRIRNMYAFAHTHTHTHTHRR